LEGFIVSYRVRSLVTPIGMMVGWKEGMRG
jgi:hypothetical protein